jgi:hypothetical protein
MAKGVLDRFNATARKRLKRLRAAAEQAADGILEMSYRDTAEQSLRGAAAVTTLMHDEMRDIETASKSANRKVRKKTKRKAARKTPQKKAKRPAAKKTVKAAPPKASRRKAKNRPKV